MVNIESLSNDDLILDSFVQRNSEIDLLSLNFFDKASINNLNWTDTEDNKEVICDRLKAYQRLLRLESLEPAEAMILLGNTQGDSSESPKPNFDSALAIASYNEEEFVEFSGLEAERARIIYQKATQTVQGGMIFLANAVEVDSPYFASSLAYNGESLHQSFSNLQTTSNTSIIDVPDVQLASATGEGIEGNSSISLSRPNYPEKTGG